MHMLDILQRDPGRQPSGTIHKNTVVKDRHSDLHADMPPIAMAQSVGDGFANRLKRILMNVHMPKANNANAMAGVAAHKFLSLVNHLRNRAGNVGLIQKCSHIIAEETRHTQSRMRHKALWILTKEQKAGDCWHN